MELFGISFEEWRKIISDNYIKDLEDRDFIKGNEVKIKRDNVKEDLYYYMKRVLGLELSFKEFCEIADKENLYGPKPNTLPGPDSKKG
jgi:hypothetical protein